eukprot:09142.XXX_280148_281420_1 [CDS] Oithona nana genome sequencing.
MSSGGFNPNQQQQFNNMNRMAMGGQQQQQMMQNQGIPGQNMQGMRPMGNMNMRPQGMSPQQQQQQYGSMNRMPMSGQQIMPNQGAMNPQQAMQGMRPMANMNMRPQGMTPQQQQHQMMMQQQQQQQQTQQMHTQQPQPSPQQPMSNQSQQPTTPMGLGDTPNSPNVAAAPSTPSGANQDGSSAQQGQTTQQPQQQLQQQQQQPQQQQIQQQQIQQQQQMQPQQPPAPTQPKEINTVMVCKIGLETVQEIVNRTHEIFNYLKALQPPFGSQNLDKVYVEKQHRLNEVLGGITQHFKRLRVCWEKANEHTSGMEYTQLESLIPFKDDCEEKSLEKRKGEPYRRALEEHTELSQELLAKNKHIKEIIDQMRNIVWEINTMLSMR